MTYIVNSTKTCLLIHFICIEIVIIHNFRGIFIILNYHTHLFKKTLEAVFLIISIVRFICFCITSQTTSAKSMFDLSIYCLRERATSGLDLLGTLIKLFLTWPPLTFDLDTLIRFWLTSIVTQSDYTFITHKQNSW